MMERPSFTRGATAFVGALLAALGSFGGRTGIEGRGRCTSAVSGLGDLVAGEGAGLGFLRPPGSRRRADESDGRGARCSGLRCGCCRPVRQRELYLACSPVEQAGQGRARSIRTCSSRDFSRIPPIASGSSRRLEPASSSAGARTFRTLPAGHVPQGVEVGSVAIGGMSSDEARAVLDRAARRRPPAELRRCLLECEPREGRSTARPPDHVDEPRSPRRPDTLLPPLRSLSTRQA